MFWLSLYKNKNLLFFNGGFITDPLSQLQSILYFIKLCKKNYYIYVISSNSSLKKFCRSVLLNNAAEAKEEIVRIENFSLLKKGDIFHIVTQIKVQGAVLNWEWAL